MFLRGTPQGAGPITQFFIRTRLISLFGMEKSSQVVTTVVAVERCLCVTRPLLVKNLLSTKTMAIVLWFLLLTMAAGVVYSSAMLFYLLCVFDPTDNTTLFYMHPSDDYLRNQFFVQIFIGIIYGLLLPALCTICVTVCTVVTVAKMRELSQWRETVSSAHSSQTARDLTVMRMIVGTSILFILCMLPSVAFRTIVFLLPNVKVGGRYENMYYVLARMFQLTSVINSSFNFFVYYTYGSKFRHTVHQLFSSCCRFN
ncbi:hypothetical protein ACOMHN_034220 [Nucella lapillus]